MVTGPAPQTLTEAQGEVQSPERESSESDPGNLRIRLRRDLRPSWRQTGDRPFVLVEDPVRSSFYRMGIGEWQFASTLDGRQTLTQVIHRVVKSQGAEATFSPTEIVQFARWLVQNGLAEAITGNDPSPQDASLRQQKLQRQWGMKRLANWNPLFIKIPFSNPDPLLRKFYPLVRPFFSPWFFALWFVTCSVAVYRVTGRFSDFRSSWNNVIAADNWLYLLITWLGLKVVHELSHAWTCIHLGGHVPRCGMMLIAFSPVAFVDVTSAWSFRSKWHRIFVSAAGMYAECFIAAIAGIVWSSTHDPQIASLSRNVVITASLSTLLFNANFLMRFDGYYILGDLLSLQNLYGTAQQYVRYLGKRYLLRIPVSPPLMAPAHRWFVQTYACVSLVWRWLFYCGMVLVAAKLFAGAGIVLAVFSGLVWFVGPCWQFVRYLVQGRGNEVPDRIHFARVSILVILVGGLTLLLPWPGSTSAPGVIEFEQLEPLRADSPGFVSQVYVHAGQLVKSGDLLIKLSNPDLQNELADLELNVQRLEIERRGLHRNNEMAQVAVVSRRIESTEQQIQQLRRKVEHLEVRAPLEGQVIGRNLENLVGVFAESGKLLVSVGRGNTKSIHASVKQGDIGLFRNKLGGPVQVRPAGRPWDVCWGTLERTTPRASHRIPHPALTATLGGPLTVRRKEGGETSEDPMELALPHFEAIAKLSSTDSERFHAGERCWIVLGRGQITVGMKFHSAIRQFFLRKSGN